MGLRDKSAEDCSLLGKEGYDGNRPGKAVPLQKASCAKLRCLDQGNDNRNGQGRLLRRSVTARIDKETSGVWEINKSKACKTTQMLQLEGLGGWECTRENGTGKAGEMLGSEGKDN